jgi:anti-sigma regulatory factor (Ser/Thr protein kinase)
MSPADASPVPIDSDAGGAANIAVRLPRERTTAAAARRLLRTRLGRLVPEDTLHDALIVVSELVSNAVVHGSGEIELRIAFDGTRLTGDVADDGRGFVRPQGKRAHDPTEANGLYLVEQIASAWGVHDGCAQVWFEIPERPLC